VSKGREEAVMRKIKYWQGNLDGKRQGLVAAHSKKEAATIAGAGVYDFNNFWYECDPTEPAITRPFTLFVRPFDDRDGNWTVR
jgi:hypothetical protein